MAYNDRRRSKRKTPARPFFREGGIVTKTLNEIRAEAGLDPADCDGEITIPLKDAKATFTVKIDSDAFVEHIERNIESIREAFAVLPPIIYGKNPILRAREEMEIAILKKRGMVPTGKNLYRRKLRIRR